ncbi:peroxisomal membrane protein 11A [Ambystoma mexicanum]|uniref:peroxisomal membrane protein 11A n=1 Tax=Ambystoma mexicanum TaxID=8296 RepID=UPI0037E73BF6
MDSFVSFTNQSQGRDRIFRATQYACMLLSYLLENRTDKEKVVKKLKQVESNISSGRKLFRIGNVVHALEASKRTAQLPDCVPRLFMTIAHLNRALYFVCDSVLWLRSVGLITDINKEKWRHRATRFYYFSLLLHLGRDVYEIFLKMDQKTHHKKNKVEGPDQNFNGGTSHDEVERFYPFFVSFCCNLRSHPAVLLDITKNICDLFSPLDRLGIYKTNPGMIGMCGFISSLVGIITLASPHLKIK